MDSTRRNKSFRCVFNTTGAWETFSHTHGAECAHSKRRTSRIPAIDEALAILHWRSIPEHRRDWSLQEAGQPCAHRNINCNSRFGSVAPPVEAIARVDLSDLADRPSVATPSQILTIIGILVSYPPALRPASNSVDGNATSRSRDHDRS